MRIRVPGFCVVLAGYEMRAKPKHSVFGTVRTFTARVKEGVNHASDHHTLHGKLAYLPARRKARGSLAEGTTRLLTEDPSRRQARDPHRSAGSDLCGCGEREVADALV